MPTVMPVLATPVTNFDAMRRDLCVELRSIMDDARGLGVTLRPSAIKSSIQLRGGAAGGRGASDEGRVGDSHFSDQLERYADA